MSKAPGDVASYDGTGDWFKAYENGVSGSASEDTNWVTWQKDRIEFTINPEIPDGDYLVRAEHIAIHEAHVGKAQFYMECAQLRVTGGGNGTPGPLVKIPGLYSAEDPGIAFNKWAPNGAAEYVMPGPAVWGGGASSNIAASGGSNTSSAASAAEDSGLTAAITGQTSEGASSRGHAGSRAPGSGFGFSRVVGRTFQRVEDLP
ncbi:putative auxiliary Activity family 9 [Septoria linicola]|nr:putative auxiliary Activity family 9 [Septoria linicola]